MYKVDKLQLHQIIMNLLIIKLTYLVVVILLAAFVSSNVTLKTLSKGCWSWRTDNWSMITFILNKIFEFIQTSANIDLTTILNMQANLTQNQRYCSGNVFI